jgi:hypothetical protein
MAVRDAKNLSEDRLMKRAKQILWLFLFYLLSLSVSPASRFTSQTVQAITGYMPNVGLAGLMLITTPDGVVHTGILVAPGLVVTASSVVRGQDVRRITVEYGVDNSHPTGIVRSVVAQVQHPYLQAVYLELASVYGSSQYPLPLDTRDPNLLNSLTCTGYDQSRRLWRAFVNASNANSWTFNVTASLGSLSDADGGVPCVDFATGTAAGITFSSNTEITGKTLGDWLPVATYLGPIAAQGGRFRLRNGNAKCLDVAWGGLGDGYAVNQFSCNGGYNQLWYFDYRGAYPTIVSANSGKCLDAPNGWLNTPLQQYTCHGGPNQQFDLYLFNPGLALVSEISDHWWSSQSASACLSVTGASAADSVSTELRSCTGSADQRWTIEWL